MEGDCIVFASAGAFGGWRIEMGHGCDYYPCTPIMIPRRRATGEVKGLDSCSPQLLGLLLDATHKETTVLYLIRARYDKKNGPLALK